MDLHRLTATALAALIRSRQISAVQATTAALARVDSVNPQINAIVQRMHQTALDAAAAIDTALSAGQDPGPMAGVPITIKVNVDQTGHPTTNGLQIQSDLIATDDSPPVANLRRAGAVIIGRSNTPAFSLRWFTRNSLHGATLNPGFPGLTPGGSSGGAAAAVASGMGAIGHGTDIAGSIRYPAYACGIHGLRPGLGCVPAFNATAGDRLIGGQLMATSGPLARSASDLRLALQAMSAPDPRDPWWTAPHPTPYPRRVALAIAPDGMQTAPEIRAALESAAKTLQDHGWHIDTPSLPPLQEVVQQQLTLWMAEFALGGADALIRENDPDALFVHSQLAQRAAAPTLENVLKSLQSRARFARLWRVFLTDYPLVLLPVSAELPFPDHFDVQSESSFARVLAAQLPQIAPPFMGLPGLTLTTGRTKTHPIGIQLLADRGREDILLDAADLLAPEIDVTD